MVFARLPNIPESPYVNIFPRSKLTNSLLNSLKEAPATTPINTLGTTLINRLMKLPDTNGEKTKAIAACSGGGMKVHTIMLKIPAKNPIAAPAPVPNKRAVIITGIWANVATMPLKNGTEPNGR
jgi:hypothetical protein